MVLNGNIQREMSAPAPKHAVAPGRFWILYTLYAVFMITITGTFLSLKSFISSLFKTQKSVKGKVVVITGSGRGLGRGVALTLSKLGAHIACVDINTKNNEETVQLIRQQGGIAQAFTVNVAKSQQVEQFSKDVEKKMGPVDIVVNNAALVIGVSIDDMTYEDIRAFYEINAMGPIFMTKAFLAGMRKRNSGHIVSISSIGAKVQLPWISLYSSTKAALSKFMDTLLVELNQTPDNNIKVTTVHPYFINTSADYFKWFRTPTPVLEEDTVVDKVVDAILYEKPCVMVPNFLSISLLLDGILPYSYWSLYVKYMGSEINIPTRKDREALPYGSIVSQTTADAK